MRVTCPTCEAKYKVNPDNLPPGGGKITCKSCSTKIKVVPPAKEEPAEEPAVISSEDLVPQEAPAAPAAAPAPAAAGPAPPTPAGGGIPAGTWLECPHCQKSFNSSVARVLPPQRGPASILVLEDQEFFRDFARDLLQNDYNVVTVETVEEANAAVKKTKFDVLVVDLHLGDNVSGRTFLEAVKDKDIPSLLMTGDWEQMLKSPEWKEFRDLGVKDLVAKSMQMDDELVKKIQMVLGDYHPDSGQDMGL